jgi:hypothetical protein
MKHMERSIFAALFAVASLFVSAEPYGVVSYAEGSSFFLIRGASRQSFNPDVKDPAGLEIKPGDVLQTGKGTFLEIYLNPIQASVQIAENTSFRCDAEDSGNKSTGELYYGRVRAKVGKLAGGKTYRISSPSLVAGVRGTDFGLDVIAFAGSSSGEGPSAAVKASTLYRVFCLEGSVLVGDLSGPELKTLIIGEKEMVERAVEQGAPAETVRAPLGKATVSPEVTAFWGARPFVGPVASMTSLDVPLSYTEGPFTVTRKVWPKGASYPASIGNVDVVKLTSVMLISIGSLSCIGAAYWGSNVNRDEMGVDPAFSAGLVMMGSGSVLSLFTLLAD